MNQQQFFQTETKQKNVVCDWVKPEKLPHSSRIAPEKEEMVKIPVLGTIDSATGRITFYNKNEKI